MPNASLCRSAGKAACIPSATAIRRPFDSSSAIQAGAACFVTGADLSELLARLPLAILLVNPQAQILYKNVYADEILSKRVVAECVRGKLVLNAPQARRMRDLLGAAGEIGDRSANVPIALTAPDGSFWIAQIRPQSYGEGREVATVAIVLREAVLDLDGAAALVSDVFALTPAERRALPAVLRLGHLKRVARSYGVSVNTMRTHLHNIFAKTATKRRNDLIKLVGGFAKAGCL
jgi:DNA-binding CsgD family transcriptional regulator